MSNIPFNHLNKRTVKEPETYHHKSIWRMARDHSFADRKIWHFFKSQLGLFGEPQKTQTKPANRIPFASQKEKEEHNVGDLKSENGKQYIFLETTIGKPRWHSHEELVTMAKEGKKIPEIAKKKMSGLEEVKEDKYAKRRERDEAEQKKKPQTLKAMEALSAHGNLVGDPEDAVKVFPEQYRGAFLRKYSDAFETNYKYDSEKQSAQDKFYDYWNEKFRKQIENKMNESKETNEPESKQAELVKPESNVKKKSTPVEKYVQDKIREGNNEPAISRQQEIRKNEATEKQKEQQEELTKLLQRKAQLQREIGSELEASKKVKKGGQEYEVDTKDVARQEMKQLDKKIGNLKQALGKIGENVFEQAQNEDMFSQSPAKPTDQLSENINKKVVEQSEKEKPTLKTLMDTQRKVLELAEIPEQDIPMYALNSMADGAKLRSYSTEVIKGEMTPEQAADKVKSDYTKMKEGEKPTNVAPLPSSEEKKVEPEASTEQKEPHEMTRKEFAEDYLRSVLRDENPTIEKYPEESKGSLEAHEDMIRKRLEEGKTVSPEVLKDYPDLEKEYKDTLPLLPSEKDVKEGDTKTINNITYQLKRGESGELRWHRVTEEEKKEKPKLTAIESDIKKSVNKTSSKKQNQ